MSVKKSKIKRIKRVETPETGYVYDVAMKNRDTPYFFANNILAHNSAYFSVYEAFRDQYEKQTHHMSKDEALELYDAISNQTNESFPAFMDQRFNTGIENGSIIKAGRENLSDYSLFIKRKRYAMNLFEKDGFRQDVDGKPGKLKVMGIEIKRSDTPKEIQNALSAGLKIILNGGSADEMLEYFREFKDEYQSREPWRLGRPSSANAVAFYTKQHQDYISGRSSIKPRISGAVMASIAWNEMLDLNEEDHLTRITDGSKVITCRLKKNDYGYNSIAYLTDQTKFPDWFKELPFDTEHMLQGILYKKIENIFGVLGWNLDYIKTAKSFDSIFDKVSLDDIDMDDLFD